MGEPPASPPASRPSSTGNQEPDHGTPCLGGTSRIQAYSLDSKATSLMLSYGRMGPVHILKCFSNLARFKMATVTTLTEDLFPPSPPQLWDLQEEPGPASAAAV